MLAACGSNESEPAVQQEESTQVEQAVEEVEEAVAEPVEEEVVEQAAEEEAATEETVSETMEETGGETPATSIVELPEVDPLSVTGDIITAGSSTVFPLSERMAERFQDEGYSGNITVDSIGSGAGFERFCVAGESDISNASRPIKDSEIESCRAIGREPIEFRVGTDALAVTVSTENDFVEDVDIRRASADLLRSRDVGGCESRMA